MSEAGSVRHALVSLWHGITWFRVALSNLLFLLVLGLLVVFFVGVGEAPPPERAALLLDPAGSIVDEQSMTQPVEALLGSAAPGEQEVLLRDVVEAVRFAAQDPTINSLVLKLDDLTHIGLSKSQEVAQALAVFHATGKPIVAVADVYSQDRYFLASYADTVIVHPLGGVGLEGFASYQNYLREALDKLAVTMHVFRAGEHKSAMEPFTRNDMSEDNRTITRRWLQVLWGQYTDTVEQQRGLAAGSIDAYVNDFSGKLAAVGGDTAELALTAGLVDKVMSRGETDDYLLKLVGAADDGGDFAAVAYDRYVARQRAQRSHVQPDRRVAVITARGNMLPGEQPAGTIGGDSLSQLVLATGEREDVDAIVLRIDSGGGSMFAAEVIRRAIVRVREMGKPVIASMGSVAASGGYYIAAAADEIWATPATITGSIGVFAAFPTFEGTLQHLGVHTDGVGTSALAGSLRVDRPLNPQVAAALGSGVAFSYRQFLQIVADGRNMPLAQVEPLAGGRVWSSPDAQRAGLVDHTGTLDDAVAAAAAQVGLSADSVDYVGLPISPADALLRALTQRMGRWQAPEALLRPLIPSALIPALSASVQELAQLRDPRNIYARCLSCAHGP